MAASSMRIANARGRPGEERALPSTAYTSAVVQCMSYAQPAGYAGPQALAVRRTCLSYRRVLTRPDDRSSGSARTWSTAPHESPSASLSPEAQWTALAPALLDRFVRGNRHVALAAAVVRVGIAHPRATASAFPRILLAATAGPTVLRRVSDAALVSEDTVRRVIATWQDEAGHATAPRATASSRARLGHRGGAGAGRRRLRPLRGQQSPRRERHVGPSERGGPQQRRASYGHPAPLSGNATSGELNAGRAAGRRVLDFGH
jgi:hypothetical protein